MPDNSTFMVAAYIAAAIIYGGYAVSLVVRRRTVRGQPNTPRGPARD